jgi:MFS family permease
VKIGELKTLGIGFTLMFLGFIAITLTDVLWVYMVLYYILNLGLSLSIPVFNSLISQHADKDKLGELMGISESIQSLSNAIFPVIAAAIYGAINYNIYIGLSLLPLAGGIITFNLIKKLNKNEENY